MQLYRRNFPLFAGTSSLPTVVLLVFAVSAGVLFGILSAGARLGLQTKAVAMVLLAIMVGVLIALGIAATVFTQAGVTDAAVGVIRGRKKKIREALASVRPYFWRYFGLMLLQMLIVAGIPGAALAAIFMPLRLFGKSGRIDPGFAAAILFLAVAAAMVAAAILAVRIVMAMAVSVAEDRAAVASLRRAIHLSKGTRGRIFVMFLVVWALTAALMMIAYVPMVVVFAIAGIAGQGNAHSAAVLIVAECFYLIFYFAIQMIVPPVYLIALVLFYYDQRIRKEGYDIEWMMQQAGLAVPEAAALQDHATPSSMPLPPPATVKEL